MSKYRFDPLLPTTTHHATNPKTAMHMDAVFVYRAGERGGVREADGAGSGRVSGKGVLRT